MKIEILKDNLEEASQIISRVSNKNLSLPVLSCAVIVATPERTVLRGTNLEVSVEIQLKAKVLEEGIIAVPAYTLHQLVSTSTEQKIILESEDTTLLFSGGHGTSKLKTLDVSEFPTLPYVKEGQGTSFSLNAKELIRGLKSVSFASMVSGIRPELSSVYLKLGDGVLTTVATDSFRLAEIKTPIKSKTHNEPLLIPIRNIQEIIRILEHKETVEVRVDENQITFIADGSYLTSRVIDGAFPDYTAIIPKQFSTTITVLRQEIMNVLRKVSVFTDATGQVEFTISVENKKFSVAASNQQVGEIYENIDAVIEGDSITLFFNIKYILEVLHVMTADSVHFKFSGPGKPLIVSEVPEKGFTYLVMPMNK